MTRRTLRIGIVGCGRVARNHLAGYQATKGVQVVSVFDVSPRAARAFARQAQTQGIRVAESLRQMAAEDDLNAVSICTPPSVHGECARPFLAAHIPVYCEKPLELNAASAARLAAAAKKSGTLFMMGLNHRFHPPIIELKKLIKAGTLGKPLLLRNIFGGMNKLKGNHRADPELSGGGCLIDHCSHSVDLFRHLVGEPTHVQAWAGNVIQDVAIEDFGMIHLSVGGKAFGEITGSYSLPATGNWVEWHGTKGSAVVSYWNEGHPDLAYRLAGGQWKPVDCSMHPASRYVGAIQHFVKCVRTEKPPLITVEDGLRANRIIAAVYKSNREGRRVRIQPLARPHRKAGRSTHERTG